MIPIKTESAWRGTADCQNCGIRDMVLFADLNQDDFSLIHTPIDDLLYKPGQSLFSEAQHAGYVYTLRKGMLKLVRLTPDGRQRIVRILRPGDVAGPESIVQSQDDTEAVALTDVSVCRIPVMVIHDLSQNSPRLHKRLMQKWQGALKEADDWLSGINFGTARQRVRQFILKMRQPDAPDVALLFSRDDMGAMMDLKLETVSREVSALTKDGVIVPLDKQGRLYKIALPEALQNG